MQRESDAMITIRPQRAGFGRRHASCAGDDHADERTADRRQQLQRAPITAGPEVDLADGNRDSDGGIVITRRDHRQLITQRGDWVRNGDRLRVLSLIPRAGLSGDTLSGPAAPLCCRLRTCGSRLGSAAPTPPHAARGVTADTKHGLIAGDASQQLLYTMLTRGRTAESVYLTILSRALGGPTMTLRGTCGVSLRLAGHILVDFALLRLVLHEEA